MSESGVYSRQILTSKVDPRAVRVYLSKTSLLHRVYFLSQLKLKLSTINGNVNTFFTK